MCIHRLVRFYLGPRSSNIVRTVREPLDRLDPLRRHLDAWEVALYVMGVAFLLQGASIDAVECGLPLNDDNRPEQRLFFRALEALIFT